MGNHIVNGLFQSDKYPTCPAGKVPLSVKDTTAQDLLWEYAQRRRTVDAEFSDDLETALRVAGYKPIATVLQLFSLQRVRDLQPVHPDNPLEHHALEELRAHGWVCWVNNECLQYGITPAGLSLIEKNPW